VGFDADASISVGGVSRGDQVTVAGCGVDEQVIEWPAGEDRPSERQPGCAFDFAETSAAGSYLDPAVEAAAKVRVVQDSAQVERIDAQVCRVNQGERVIPGDVHLPLHRAPDAACRDVGTQAQR